MGGFLLIDTGGEEAMTDPLDPHVTQLAEAIVEMHRRVYALDLDLADAYAELWREQQAQGVSRETFRAAIVLARPRTAALFIDYGERLSEAAMERLTGTGDDA
jgi:hypothetical protein